MRTYLIIIDFLVALIIVLVVNQPWQTRELTPEHEKFLREFDERQLAASAIKDEAMAGVTVASILLVAIGACLTIGNGQLNEFAKGHLWASSLLCVVSLASGLWIIGSLPTWVNFYNVAHEYGIALLCVFQVVVTLLASLRLLLGLRRLLL